MIKNYRVVLVEPQTSGNIGSVARAMRNFGFKDLVLVNPATSHTNRFARAMAMKALPLLNQAKVVDQIEDALEGCVWAVGFTGVKEKRAQDHRDFSTLIPPMNTLTATDKKIALVFGREDWGLDHFHMDRCRFLTHFKTHPDYTSLNLAQAVLLACFSIYQTAGVEESRGVVAEKTTPIVQIDDHEAQLELDEALCVDRERLYTDLEETLLHIGYLRTETAKSSMRHLRRIIERTHLQKEEVQTLRGVCRSLRWAKLNNKIAI